ncbi:hypothetical protein N0V93_002120 [Gnomoniopsis smithogilvyi]|uniref:Uncharacterized protein n=1 Tax=Gnomoniopsis smithogilvyi TaxID=1191159 RepID=A0A9W8Z595_9PEZI|nr:hypothetical protein N0V93_002120 [Gnomoniopsis smithogilvyi]
MDTIAKVFYDPLLSSRLQIQNLLLTLPIGSAHPFRGELLVRSSQSLVTSVDISMHTDGFFTNAVSIDYLGQQVLDRMKLFPGHIGAFNEEYHIQQAPASTFHVPIIDGLIHIFAVSVRDPTYYDLCVGDSTCRCCCYEACHTFEGIEHSGDCESGNVLLEYIKLDSALEETPRTIFVSGYHNHALHKYKKRNPMVLVANHSTKTLYIVPLPLDTATIGLDATICCPLVIKKNARNNTNVLGDILTTTAFAQAISRGNALLEALQISGETYPQTTHPVEVDPAITDLTDSSPNGQYVVVATHSSKIDHLEPLTRLTSSAMQLKASNQSTTSRTTPPPQIIRFGKGIQWMPANHKPRADISASTSILPCILGSIMEGPMVLAIGQPPMQVPFSTMIELHDYYSQARSLVVLMDENMTDNARNVATTWRVNGLFILQTAQDITPDDGANVVPILNNLNINAVTALAGPQSFIMVQLGAKYFFYRGISNPDIFNVWSLNFGQDITDAILTHGLTKAAERIHLPSWPRLVDLAQGNPVHLSNGECLLGPEHLQESFEDVSMDNIMANKDDIAMIIPQLQALLPEEELHDLSQTLIKLISDKVDKFVEPSLREYSTFIVREFDPTIDKSNKKRNMLLSNLRQHRKWTQSNIQWLTTALGNIVSTQTTSSRTHDLRRLARKTAIQSNVANAQAMNFEKLSGVLEEHAAQMGVLVVNVSTESYLCYVTEALYLRGTPPSAATDPCFLDQRVLYLDGLDAGIVLKASQCEHSGPLSSQQGSKHPILALPYLNKRLGSSGSMLAWICWDEFVRLRNPYAVRWMEKCNEPNIAALRVIMRGTLSQAVSSRNLANLEPTSKNIGQLMGALLMSTMRKLAETRSSVPNLPLESVQSRHNLLANSDSVDLENSIDTSTLLMRGLFGNLLTVAGSGTQPLSYVWQLFGKVPTFEIPTSNVA